jgi:cytochrome c-type biogenesis protein CcmE
MVNVFGIAHSVQNSVAYGIQFSLSDKSDSINVVFPGPLPEAFEMGSPVVVQGEFDGERFKATTILAQFSSEYFPKAALDELRSYGVLIDKD